MDKKPSLQQTDLPCLRGRYHQQPCDICAETTKQTVKSCHIDHRISMTLPGAATGPSQNIILTELKSKLLQVVADRIPLITPYMGGIWFYSGDELSQQNKRGKLSCKFTLASHILFTITRSPLCCKNTALWVNICTENWTY